MADGTVRAFVAVELPDAAQELVGGLIERLRGRDEGNAVRWVRPEGVHVTLLFLGNVPEDQVGPVGEAVRAAASAVSGFDLALGQLGSFGPRRNGGRGQVVWVGIEGDLAALERLARGVESALRGAGAAGSERQRRAAFTPHLTLGRARRGGRPLPAALTTEAGWPPAPAPPGARFRVEAVSLMRSDLRADGARYARLVRAPLTGRQPGS